MNIYYYVHTGHRFGLDRFWGAVALINALPELNITLLTSDYRIASSAKDYGVKKAIGLDVLRNIPNVAEHGDILIYDSDEHHEQQLLDMVNFFSKFIRVTVDPNDHIRGGEFLINPYLEDSNEVISALPVSSSFFVKEEKKDIELLLFFGDDDYDKDLLRYLKSFKNLKPDLLLGFYYFLQYEDEVAGYVGEIYEHEDYEDVIKRSKTVITSSYQTALQTLASGGQPIYIERADRTDSVNRYLEKLGIPVLTEFSEEKILQTIESSKEYQPLEDINIKVAQRIKDILN